MAAPNRITWTLGDLGTAGAADAIARAGDQAKRALDRSAGRLSRAPRFPAMTALDTPVTALVSLLARTQTRMIEASERVGGGYGRLVGASAALPLHLAAGVGSSRVVSGIFDAASTAIGDLAIRMLDLAPVAEDVWLRIKPRLDYLADWVGHTFWRSIDRLAATLSLLWSRAALAAVRLSQTIVEVGLAGVDLIRVALPASLDRTLTRALGSSLARIAGVASSLEASGRSARQKLATIDADIMEPLSAYVLRATMPGRDARTAGTISRGELDGESMLDRINRVLGDWLRSPGVSAVGDAIGQILASGEERLGSLLGGVSVALRAAATSLAGIGETLAPVGVATLGLTEALATVGDQAERIAQSSSTAARIVSRSRAVVIASLALVRVVIETARGVAAFVSFQYPQAAMHFVAAGLFGAAAGVALAGGVSGGRRARIEVPRGALSSRAFAGLAQPRASGMLTLVVRSTVALPDEEWTRRNILEPIASGGAVAPPGAIVREIDMRRPPTPDELREILRQVGEHVLFTPGVGILEFFGLGFLIPAQGELKRFGRRVDREVRRIRRRIFG